MTTVLLSPEAVEHVADLPKVIKARVGALLARLEEWPATSGAKPLKGDLAGRYRMRTGDYRLLFRVEQVRRSVKVVKTVKGKEVEEERAEVDYTIIVERIGHRSTFYED